MVPAYLRLELSLFLFTYALLPYELHITKPCCCPTAELLLCCFALLVKQRFEAPSQHQVVRRR